MSELRLNSKTKANIFNQSDIEVFSNIEYAGVKYKLRKPIVCNVKQNNSYYYIESAELQIIAGGKNRKEAILDFSEDFNYIYRNYNELPDNKLSERLLKVKKNINKLIVKVEYAGS